MPYIHVLLEYPPKPSISQIISSLKGLSSPASDIMWGLYLPHNLSCIHYVLLKSVMFAAIVNYVKMIANEYLMSWSAALPTFFITLREGVEAPLVVGIVFACLHIARYI